MTADCDCLSPSPIVVDEIDGRLLMECAICHGRLPDEDAL